MFNHCYAAVPCTIAGREKRLEDPTLRMTNRSPILTSCTRLDFARGDGPNSIRDNTVSLLIVCTPLFKNLPDLAYTLGDHMEVFVGPTMAKNLVSITRYI